MGRSIEGKTNKLPPTGGLIVDNVKILNMRPLSAHISVLASHVPATGWCVRCSPSTAYYYSESSTAWFTYDLPPMDYGCL